MHDLREKWRRQMEKVRRQMETAKEEARREGIKEYCLSGNCYKRKKNLSLPFLRCSFYGARAYFEHLLGESFPKLAFCDDFFQFSIPDIRTMDPEGPTVDEEVEEAQQDDLEDLDKPLVPYVPSHVDASPFVARPSVPTPPSPPLVLVVSPKTVAPSPVASSDPAHVDVELDPKDTMPLSIIIPPGGPTRTSTPPAAPATNPSTDSVEDIVEMIDVVIDLDHFDNVDID